MAKITDLPAYSTPALTDVVPVVDIANNTTKKVQVQNLVPDGSIGASKLDFTGIEGEEIARVTLGAPADTISVTSIPNYKYLHVIISIIASGGTTDAIIRLNNDSTTAYAFVASAAMAAGSPGVSQTSFPFESGATDSGSAAYAEARILNISNREKMYRYFSISGDAAGGATAPAVYELMGKWANTSAVINRIDVLNSAGTGDFAAGSEVIVYGHN